MANKQGSPLLPPHVAGSPQELLEELEGLPSGSVHEDPDEWVYRGVGWSGYGLLPTALRQDTVLSIGGDSKRVADWTDREAVFAEASMLRQYLHALQRTGLQVPGGGEACARALERVLREGLPGPRNPAKQRPEQDSPDWPDDALLPLLGLAQHHGLPTRLLDLTWNARVAAYFAATASLRGRKEFLSVWAINAAHLRLDGALRDKIRRQGASTADPGARLVYVDSAPNPRLQAQRGLFLLASAYSGPVPVEDVSKDWAPIEELSVPAFDNEGLRRYDLPRCHARALLAHLARLGVDAGTVYPDHAGARLAVEERMMLAERKRRIIQVREQRLLRELGDTASSKGA